MEFATRTEYVLFYIGCISSLLFLFKFILMCFGEDLDNDFLADAGDSDGDFTVFSINVILCFLMSFGWVGLALIKEWGFSFYSGIGLAFVGGIIASSFFIFLLSLAKSLDHTPKPFSLKRGDLGLVYSRITAHGIGKVNIQNRIVKATSDSLIQSFAPIIVLEDTIIHTNTVVKVKEKLTS